MQSLLASPEWLTGKLAALNSPQKLLADYDLYAEGELERLIGSALRLALGICTRDKRQLIPQLHGRLLARSEAEEFRAAARNFLVPPAIVTLRPSLTPTGRELARLEGHTASVSALAVLPDGRLASGSDDETIRLWDANTGRETARLEVDFAVNCLAGLDGNRLAAGDAGGRIHWLEIVD